MTDQAKAAEIVARLERLTAPDREVNREIDWHFSEWENMGGYLVRHKITGEMKGTSYPESPAYTASLDAAIGLVERVLPGWWGSYATKGHPAFENADDAESGRIFTAELYGPVLWQKVDGYEEPVFSGAVGRSSTRAIALLIACFKARALAQGE